MLREPTVDRLISPEAPVTSTPVKVGLTLPIVSAPVLARKMPPVAVVASKLLSADSSGFTPVPMPVAACRKMPVPVMLLSSSLSVIDVAAMVEHATEARGGCRTAQPSPAIRASLV